MMASILLWGLWGGLLALAIVRFDLVKRWASARVDARPAGLLRWSLGGVCTATLFGFGRDLRLLFTDEGMLLASRARLIQAPALARSYDPDHGFEFGADLLDALWGKFSVFFFDNSPAVVWGVLILTVMASILMTVGWQTRFMTVVTWLGLSQFYHFVDSFQSGWDDVLRIFLFWGMFCDWGATYGFDARRRRLRLSRKGGGNHWPKIAGWPIGVMLVQLTVIYTGSGVTKIGPTWWYGSALYYALNLQHFYRVPMQSLVWLGHWSGLLPIASMLVHWWEMLFGLFALAYMARRHAASGHTAVLSPRRLWAQRVFLGLVWVVIGLAVGVAVKSAHDPESAPGKFSKETAQILVSLLLCLGGPLVFALVTRAHRKFRRGFRLATSRRLWLGLGLGMHLGIALLMNVGLFPHVMMSIYWVFVTGDDFDALGRWVVGRGRRFGRPDGVRAWVKAIYTRAFVTELPDQALIIFRGAAGHKNSMMGLELFNGAECLEPVMLSADEPSWAVKVGGTVVGEQQGLLACIERCPALRWLAPVASFRAGRMLLTWFVGWNAGLSRHRVPYSIT